MLARKLVPVALVALAATVSLAARPSAPVAATAVASLWSAPALPAPVVATTAVAVTIRFTVAPTGNEARYRVREQLVGRDLPNDAVGATREISGGLVIDAGGSIIAGESRFVIGVHALTSDSDRRDGYVKRRLLETEANPTVTFAPTAVSGVPSPLPTAGSASFDVVGNLTVRGTTRPTTWHVTGRYDGGAIKGSASTAFTFDEFGITRPRVPVLLSVADTIKLEYDFTLVRKP